MVELISSTAVARLTGARRAAKSARDESRPPQRTVLVRSLATLTPAGPAIALSVGRLPAGRRFFLPRRFILPPQKVMSTPLPPLRVISLALCLVALCLLYSLLGAQAGATILPPGFAETRLPYNLSFPTCLTVAPDGRLFVCEQSGNIRIFKDDVLLPAPFVSLDVDHTGERGIIGICLDPNFTSNHWVYVCYTVPTPTMHNRLSRFTANGDVVAPGSEVVLLELDDLVSNQHNSGGIRFGKDGKIYLASGDNYDAPNAQLLSNLKGKILRLNPDGTIPSDNPFLSATTGKNRAIWALGLRNPYTLDIQPGSGRIFINEVGFQLWEEINEGAAGANFGWPNTEGPTTNPLYRAPFFAYGHGAGESLGCAITGGAFYHPAQPQFPAEYLGKYFFIDFCNQWIRVLDPVSKNVTPFATGITAQNTVYVVFSPDGALYYLTVADPWGVGAVFKIRFTGNLAPQIGNQPVSLLVSVGEPAAFAVTAYGSQPITYQWRRNAAPIAGATTPTYSLPTTDLLDHGAIFDCVIVNSYGSTTSLAATLSVTTNRPPLPAIALPLDGSFYNAGDTISFAGAATDLEDGVLPPSAFRWQVLFHHDDHIHPFLESIPGVASGSFAIPTDGEVATDVSYRLFLDVTDSAGLTTSTFADVHPRLSQLNLTTNPPTLQVTLDGIPLATPLANASVVNMTRTLGVVSPQTLNGLTYEFDSWSDGGAASHKISTPAAVTTYTANFSVKPLGTLTASPNPIYVSDGSGLGSTTIAWDSSGTVGVEVHVGSPSGPLFAASGAGPVSAVTGKWVSNGMLFFLQNVTGGRPLTSAHTLASVTVGITNAIGSISANPNPALAADGSGLAATTLSWSSTGTSVVEVHVNAPNGPLFGSTGPGPASGTTDKWVVNGMVFYLQNVSNGKPLTSSNTLATVTVAVKNNLLPQALSQSASATEDQSVAITLAASDPDGASLTYSIVSAPAHGTLSGIAPNLTYTPAQDYFGADSFTFKANDGLADSNVATVAISVTGVNDAPVAVNGSVTTLEDQPQNITLGASDVDGPSLTYSIVTAPAHGALTGAGPNLTYTPAQNYNGADSFAFKANDGLTDSNLATVSISVTAVNDAPVAANRSVTTLEDQPQSITLSATDVDGASLTYAIVARPTHGVLNGTGANLTYTPAANYNGPDSFTFRANDGLIDSNLATVSIGVTPVNDAPVATKDSAVTRRNTAVAISVLANDSDVDGDALTVASFTAPSKGRVTVGTSAKTVTYTPSNGFIGIDTFTYTASDGHGGTATATVTVTVNK
jgi:glucose/arabinose dehydrogenase